MSDDTEDATNPRDASPVPWTVKGMPKDQRDAINAAARRASVTVAAFIWDACDAKIRASRVPIGVTEPAPAGHPGSSLVPVERASHGPDPIEELAKLTDMAVRLSAEGTGRTDVLSAARRAVIAKLDRFAK
jgi:hypothetical protein